MKRIDALKQIIDMKRETMAMASKEIEKLSRQLEGVKEQYAKAQLELLDFHKQLIKEIENN